MPLPRAVVHLCLPAEQSFTRAQTRLEARDKSNQSPEIIARRITKAHGDVQALIHRQSLLLRAGKNMAARGVPVIQIATNGSLDAAIAETTAALQPILTQKNLVRRR